MNTALVGVLVLFGVLCLIGTALAVIAEVGDALIARREGADHE